MIRRLLIFLLLGASKTWAQAPIDTAESIPIGGIKQYITIKGHDRSKPLLLFLHGGPGGSVMSYADKFTKILQESFVVVQWDQRETGQTLELNASPVPLTVELFGRDTYELTTYLLNRFHQKKLFLAGHSWGTTLGFHMVAQHPDLLHAYIAISPMINQMESERLLLKILKDKAARTGNKTAEQELSTVHIPFENGEQLYYQRKWLFDLAGRNVKTFARDFVLSWAERWLMVWNEASAINLMDQLPVVHCPVYFCVGRTDHQTNYGITEAYYQKLVAPKKDLFWFDTGHNIPSAKPTELQDVILKKILPAIYPE